MHLLTNAAGDLIRDEHGNTVECEGVWKDVPRPGGLPSTHLRCEACGRTERAFDLPVSGFGDEPEQATREKMWGK